MAHRYLYADTVESGRERREPERETALTADQAAQRFAGDSERLEDGFGVGLVGDDGRVTAWLEMAPGARRAVLKKLTPQGSVAASCEWDLPAGQPAVFLRRLTWFAYPSADRYFSPDQAAGAVSMQFDPSGRATRERFTDHGFRDVGPVETSEYDDVDVTPNWIEVPAFGDWDGFFHPHPTE